VRFAREICRKDEKQKDEDKEKDEKKDKEDLSLR
jgi:hypothetical protein